MVSKDYLSRQATTLLKLARLEKNPQVAAGLIDKVADLTTRADAVRLTEDTCPTPTDVKGGTGL